MFESFEHRGDPLASRDVFLQRVGRYTVLAVAIILTSQIIGVLGYHFSEGLSWIDALLDASMTQTGMGLASPVYSTPGKLFATIYAIFAGIAFPVAIGVFISPVFHRFLHHFHLGMKDKL